MENSPRQAWPFYIVKIPLVSNIIIEILLKTVLSFAKKKKSMNIIPIKN